MNLLQLAWCPDLLAVHVHCGGGPAQHPHCSVQQELRGGDRESSDQCHPHSNRHHPQNGAVCTHTSMCPGKYTIADLIINSNTREGQD